MSKAARPKTPSHDADSHDLIRVQGARVNNLQDVSVEIPKRRLTAFTGVSGSGKSSLVFSTIAAESQRLINETYSSFVQGFMPTMARPEVDVLEGLTTAIIVDQERMGGDSRSTVGTATDATAMLRILFSRIAKPHIGSPSAYSFNVPSVSGSGGITVERGDKTITKAASFNRLGGMCPRCEGRGTVNDFDLTALYDDSKSLNEGALTIPGYSMEGWYGRIYRGCGYFDPDKPIKKFNKKEMHDLLYREPTKIKVDDINLTYAGLIPQIQKSYLSKDVDSLQPHIRRFVEKAVVFTTCPDCDGTRLAEEARSSKIKKINIADACAMQITDLAEWLGGVKEKSVAPLIAALQHTLDSFVEIGLGYLSLDRPSGTLSGGEAAAHEDDPPARLLAHRRDLRLRRAHHRPAPARHRADEPAAAAPARQGQHGAGGRAQAGGHRATPTTWSTSAPAPAATAAGWCSRAPSTSCATATPSPAATWTTAPSLKETVRESTERAGGARRGHPQPAGRGRGHPAGPAGRGHRRGRVGQELADRRLGGGPRRGRVDRPERDPRLAAEQPGHVLRAAGPDPQGVREGERRQARAVQRQLRRRLPELQRRRRDLHGPGHDGRRLLHLRGLRREALRRGGAGVRVRRPRHQPGAGDVGGRGREVLRRGRQGSTCRRRTRSWTGWPTSGWAT